MQPAAKEPPAPCSFELPSFAQPGRPVEIKGRFTGDAGQTGVKMGGKDAKVLAESPRKVVVRVPPDLVGMSGIEVFEKGQPVAKGEFRSIGVKLSAGKTNLLKGERTQLSITIYGLEGLKEPVSLRLENNSPGVVTIKGGNVQTFSVDPKQVVDGQVLLTRTLSGIRPGAFAISAFVETHLHPVNAAPPTLQ